MSEDERMGGRITVLACTALAVLWYSASAITVGGPNDVAAGGAAAFVASGFIVGALIGCYNLGRRRGR